MRKEVLYKNGTDFRRLFEEKEETFPSNFDELWKKLKERFYRRGAPARYFTTRRIAEFARNYTS